MPPWQLGVNRSAVSGGMIKAVGMKARRRIRRKRTTTTTTTTRITTLIIIIIIIVIIINFFYMCISRFFFVSYVVVVMLINHCAVSTAWRVKTFAFFPPPTPQSPPNHKCYYMSWLLVFKTWDP
jgi:hypothetical protein